MQAASRMSLCAVAATVAAMSAFYVGLSHSERLIETSFASALEHRPALGPVARVGAGFDPAHLHLSNLPSAAPLALSGAVRIGDTISLSAQSGGTTSYEVVDVRPMHAAQDGPFGDIADVLLVTAASTGLGPTATVRFVIEAKRELVPPAQTKQRAL